MDDEISLKFKAVCAIEADRLKSVGTTHASQNVRLNRYLDIIPFDHNRVVIGNNGYINASHLSSLFGNARYIAAQGPLNHTIDDFWKMIWDQKSPMIVMLTKLEEGGRVKCHCYWPSTLQPRVIPYENQELTVKCISEERLSIGDGYSRKFSLKYNQEERIVAQVHYEGWPDHGVADIDSLLQLIDTVNQIVSTSSLGGPMVVHCSAGCGRTGTFCTIDGLQKDLEADCKPGLYHVEYSQDKLDRYYEQDLLVRTVNHLRKQRISSVQSFGQFQLLYEAFNWS